MAAPVPRSARTSQFGPYADDIGDDYPTEVDDTRRVHSYSDAPNTFAPVEFEPGERIGRPLASARRKLIVRAAVAGLIALGGGWVWINHPATVSEWTTVVAAGVSTVLERKAPSPVAPVPQLPPAHSMASGEPPAAPALPAMAPMTTATLSPATAPPDEDTAAPPAEKLPPPIADPADPYQVRALAVGLHPGLSRVLLAKLTPADYRNAGIAIKTALAETPDTGVFVWPRQRTPELALFQVKFVSGAAPDCRRYVVMVTKDGWLTTALPMETCGVRAKPARN